MDRLFKVYDKNKNERIGYLILVINEVHDTQYKNLHYLEIKTRYWTKTSTEHSTSVFYTSYQDDHSNKIASISSNTSGVTGDIKFNFAPMMYHRIGTLIMSIKVDWLKLHLPNDFPIKGIHFHPYSGDEAVAKQFYTNFGIPIDGEPFTVADLVNYLTWKENIHEISTQNLDSTIADKLDKISDLTHQYLTLREINQATVEQYKNINIFNFYTPMHSPLKLQQQNQAINSTEMKSFQSSSDQIIFLIQCLQDIERLEQQIDKERYKRESLNYNLRERFERALAKLSTQSIPYIVFGSILFMLYTQYKS